jgi:hypothetical protein
MPLTEDNLQAAERLSRLPKSTLAKGPNRQSERDRARSYLDVVDPMLDGRESAREDAEYLNAAEALAEHLEAGGDLDSDLQGDKTSRFRRSMAAPAFHGDRRARLKAVADEKRALLHVGVGREPRT